MVNRDFQFFKSGPSVEQCVDIFHCEIFICLFITFLYIILYSYNVQSAFKISVALCNGVNWPEVAVKYC